MRKMNRLLVGVMFFLSACTGTVATSAAASLPTRTPTRLPPTQMVTPTPTLTETPTPTFTPSPIPTATWVVQGPGDVTVPILLYHRIDISPIDSRYYVSPQLFEEEIKALHDWGYKTISVEMLVQAISTGRELPPHPILITFDDGHLDNYTNAFPIMQKYGFTGAIYIVGNYMGAEGFMTAEQILEMYAAGWDVGSHSMNHLDLTKLEPEQQRTEIIQSKKKLEQVLGIDVLTFAYPFGAKDASAVDLVHTAGYIAAMGAQGYTDSQGEWNLFNLQRVEIKSSETIETMKRFLSWHGPQE